MGEFATSVPTMQKAVQDIAAAKALVDSRLSMITTTAEGTLTTWRGAGGDALRSLMLRYDASARELQRAIDGFRELLDQQAAQYGVTDSDATEALAAAGTGLRM
jgi:WXG100 family type VII secretion target